MKRLLGALLRPIVEESQRQIHAQRAAEASSAGLGALDKLGFMLLGPAFPEREGAPQSPQSSSGED
jgi:hypothetical protein